MIEDINDFLKDVGDAADASLVPESSGASFADDFDLDAFRNRLRKGYLIKDKRSAHLLRFGPMLVKRPVQQFLLRRFIEELNKGGPVRFIVLKSRKLGCSTITDVLLTELAIQFAYWKVGILAHTESATGELFSMVKNTVERMEPAGMCPEIRYNSDLRIEFGSRAVDARRKGEFGHQAWIMGETAGAKSALSGSTVNALHLSECAKYNAIGGIDAQDALIISVLGAVPKVGTSLVVAESTANGKQGWFYRTWLQSIRGVNDDDGVSWIPIFIPWFKDPDCWDRVPEGYRWDRWDPDDMERERVLVEKHGVKPEQLFFRRKTLKRDMGMRVELWDQEFPDSWETAFIARGNGLFGRRLLERMNRGVSDAPAKWDAVDGSDGNAVCRPSPMGPVEVWEDPEPGAEYIMGADVADGATFGVDGVGRAETDASTFSIYKRTPTTMEQVAQCIHRGDNFEFGRLCAVFAAHYNHALVNVERNRAQGVIAGLRTADYPVHRLYRPPVSAAVTEGLAASYFFHKTAANSKFLMDTLLSWANGRLVVRSATLMEELSTLERDVNGRVETNSKDLTIATAMAVVADATTDMEIDAAPGSVRHDAPPAWNRDPVLQQHMRDAAKKESPISYDEETGLYQDAWDA